MKMTEAQARARAEAYNECGSHLEQTWTEDPIEWAEGRKLRKLMFRRYKEWLDRADAIAEACKNVR